MIVMEYGSLFVVPTAERRQHRYGSAISISTMRKSRDIESLTPQGVAGGVLECPAQRKQAC